MRPSQQALLLAGVLAGCSDKQPPMTYDPQTARSNLLAVLPSGWAATAAPWQQHGFTTNYFADPRTEEFMLVGPQSNVILWEDRAGGSHVEALAKECLYIWIVPGDFSPRFQRFTISGPNVPDRVFSSRGVRVYGLVRHHIVDTNRMDQIMQAARMISSPEIRVSWASWRRDIATALKK